MTDVSRLQVLEHAREIAERLGAVGSGSRFYEDADGRDLSASAITGGRRPPEDVCGVCIAGALALAEVIDTGRGDVWAWIEGDILLDCARAELADHDQADFYYDTELSDAITDLGTPYVLAVLDRMIEVEREQVAA